MGVQDTFHIFCPIPLSQYFKKKCLGKWDLWDYALSKGHQLWTPQKKAVDDIAIVTCWAISVGTDRASGQSMSTWL